MARCEKYVKPAVSFKIAHMKYIVDKSYRNAMYVFLLFRNNTKKYLEKIIHKDISKQTDSNVDVCKCMCYGRNESINLFTN